MELSGDADTVSGSGSSCRKRSVQRSLEYPLVSRLRHRRLLAFLSRHGFDATLDALVQETFVLFRVEHLVRLVRLGRWPEAIRYVTRFVVSAGTHQLGDAGWVFIEFLHMHAALDYIVAGKPHGAAVAEEYERYMTKYPDSCYPGTIKLGRILLAMLRSQPLRASVNWHLVRIKAAEIVNNLIAQIPEFNDLLKLPVCAVKPHDILPIGSSSHRRRHVKNKDGFQPLILPGSTFTRREVCLLQVTVRRQLIQCQDYHVRQQPGWQMLLMNLCKLVGPSDASAVL